MPKYCVEIYGKDHATIVEAPRAIDAVAQVLQAGNLIYSCTRFKVVEVLDLSPMQEQAD